MMKNLILLAVVLAAINCRILDARREISFTQSFQATVEKIKLTDEVDFTFDYKLVTNNATGIDYAPFLFGNHKNSTSEGNPVKLHASTALKKIALAGGSLATATTGAWGIDCTAENGCAYGTDTAFDNKNCPTELTGYNVYDKSLTGQQYFDATTTTCRDATTFMRWTNSTVDNTDKMITNLPVTLFETAPLTGVDAGYLGLSPSGDFFNYIKAFTNWGTDKTYVYFGLSLTPNSGADKLVNSGDKDAWKQNQFVIHGKRNGGDIPFYNPIVDVDSWTINFANFTLAKDETGWTPKESQKICVASEYPYMLAFTDQADSTAILNYFYKVCPNGDHTKCAESDATKDKVKKVQIGVGNDTVATGGVVPADFKAYELTLDTSDILWFNQSELTPIVGQYISTTDAKALYGCADTANMIVGKAFLSRYEAVMKIEADKQSLGFIANEGTSSIFLIILIILGCIILAICIAIILLKVCKRKSSDEGEYTRQD